ncbi:MAG: hypothetical protein JWN85_4991 [Gammaproteobacteria bacterium]|nr:hypothetical protein [Gammaproteobacteria bacterium]
MLWIIGLIVAIGVLAVAALGFTAYGNARWAEATRVLLGRLEAARLPPTASHYDASELEGLPAPVQSYFRAVLKDGQRLIAAATVQHTGTFNVSQTGEQWKPFESQQWVVTRRPGFLWAARMEIVPGFAVRVHDAYIGGEGILRVAVLGLFAMADLHGPGDIAQGELMRFFAEAAWYPTALLPSQGVRWEAVDEYSAKAIVVDGTLSLTMLFSFNDAGLIESVHVEARAATVGKTIVMIPWEARLSNYQERNGMRVPLSGEASWLRPQGPRPYWRGTIASLAYEFSA